MLEAKDLNSQELINVLRVWVGWGFSSYSCRDEGRVVKQFGAETATRLMPIARELEKEYYSTNAYHAVADYHEMVAAASGQFKHKLPTVADEILSALEWCYSYDFK